MVPSSSRPSWVNPSSAIPLELTLAFYRSSPPPSSSRQRMGLDLTGTPRSTKSIITIFKLLEEIKWVVREVRHFCNSNHSNHIQRSQVHTRRMLTAQEMRRIWQNHPTISNKTTTNNIRVFFKKWKSNLKHKKSIKSVSRSWSKSTWNSRRPWTSWESSNDRYIRTTRRATAWSSWCHRREEALK